MAKLNNLDEFPENDLEERNLSSLYDEEGYELSKLSTLPCKREPGFAYAWIRRHISGVDDNRVNDMGAQGWVAVPRDKASINDLSVDPLGTNPLAKKFYFQQDTVLMKCPIEKVKRRHQKILEESSQKMKALPTEIKNDLGIRV